MKAAGTGRAIAKKAHGIGGTPSKEGHSEGLGEKTMFGRDDSQAPLLNSEKIRARAGTVNEAQSQGEQNEKLQVPKSFEGLQADPFRVSASSALFLPNGQPSCA